MLVYAKKPGIIFLPNAAINANGGMEGPEPSRIGGVRDSPKLVYGRTGCVMMSTLKLSSKPKVTVGL